MDIWVVFTFWLFWVMLFSAFMNKCFRQTILFLLGVYRGMECLSRRWLCISPFEEGLSVFRSGYRHPLCTNITGPISPHCQRLLPSVFFIIIWVDAKQYPTEVLTYISPKRKDAELLVMCLLSICSSSLKKYPLRSFAHFLNYLSFCYWLVRVLYIF